MRHLLPALFALTAWAQNAQVDFARVSAALIQQRLESVVAKYSDRRATIEALFREVGCGEANLTTQKVPGSPEPNVICTLPSQTPDAGVIVVGGHFDKVTAGMGAVDDWSGAVLLPSLYQSLKGLARQPTYVFVAFAAEETGLNGSTQYVHKLTKAERANIVAMINLECLGTSTPKVWATRADKKLLGAYMATAQSVGVGMEALSLDNVGDDDSHPFKNAKIPVLTIHATDQAAFAILHSARDQVKAINPEHYHNAYRLAATYLAVLDSVL